MPSRLRTTDRDRLYWIWRDMIRRCHDLNWTKDYPNYGGRGITVCTRWRESFDNFVADVGERPSRKHTLDRIDNDGGYEPTNVRWATWAEQRANQRPRIPDPERVALARTMRSDSRCCTGRRGEYADMGRAYGVSRGVARQILTNQTYKDVA